MWITDTPYRNRHLLNPTTGKHPVFLGPVMFQFWKNEKTFERFALELIFANSKLKHLKKIGVDVESAIFNDFSNIIPTVNRLVCDHHLKKWDESKLLNLLGKTRRSSAERNHTKGEIVKGIYGSREGNYYGMELQRRPMQKTFTAKLEYFNLRWKVLCPEFFAWFNVKRKPLFLESVIQSSWEKSDINGWYYQNDTESKHAAEKRNQHLAGKHISDLHIMIKT